MTYDEIAKLEVGKYLDALITKYIFNTCPHHIAPYKHNYWLGFKCIDCNELFQDGRKYGIQGILDPNNSDLYLCYYYSDNILNTYLVIEKLLTLGIGFDIQIHPAKPIKVYTYQYYLGFRPVIAEIEGQGLAELICKVALMTVLVLKERKEI